MKLRPSIPIAVIALLLAMPAVAEIQSNPDGIVAQPSAAPEGGPINLILDDGTVDTSIGDGGQFIWLNRFTPNAADFPFELDQISVVFGATGVAAGDAVELLVWEDTDGDGDPGTGAVLLASYNDVVQVADGATFSVYALAAPVQLNGPGDVLVGVVNRASFEGAGDFPAALDQTASQVRSWAASYLAGDVPNNPTLPGDEQWGTIDSFGFPGNWLVRASGQGVIPVELQSVTID